MQLVYSITRGTLLTSLHQDEEEPSETTSTDYSSGARLHLSFADIALLLPCDEGFTSSCEVRADSLRLETGARGVLFNTLVLTAKPLIVVENRENGQSCVALHSLETELKIRLSSSLTRLTLSFDDSLLVLQERTIEQILNAVHQLLAYRDTAEEAVDEVVTEVSDSDSENSMEEATSHITFSLDISVSSLQCCLCQHYLSSLFSVSDYMKDVKAHSALKLTSKYPSFALKLSPTDKIFGSFLHCHSRYRGWHDALFSDGRSRYSFLLTGRQGQDCRWGDSRLLGRGFKAERFRSTRKEPH